MATMQKDPNQQQSQQTHGGQEQGVGSPISNDAYNIIAALHAKLEGLEAYRKYSKDGNMEIWRELTQAEMKSVERLVDELERCVQSGTLRSQASRSQHKA